MDLFCTDGKSFNNLLYSGTHKYASRWNTFENTSWVQLNVAGNFGAKFQQLFIILYLKQTPEFYN